MLSPSLFPSGVVASSVDIYRDLCPQDTQKDFIELISKDSICSIGTGECVVVVKDFG